MGAGESRPPRPGCGPTLLASRPERDAGGALLPLAAASGIHFALVVILALFGATPRPGQVLYELQPGEHVDIVPLLLPPEPVAREAAPTAGLVAPGASPSPPAATRSVRPMPSGGMAAPDGPALEGPGPSAAASAPERLRPRSLDPRLLQPKGSPSSLGVETRRAEAFLQTRVRSALDSTAAARGGLLYGPNRGCGRAGEACGIDAAGAGIPSALGSGAPLMPVEVSRAGADATPLRRDPQTHATATWLLVHHAAYHAELRRLLEARIRAIRERADSARRRK